MISDLQPIGYQALIEFFSLEVVPHYRRSYVLQRGERKIIIEKGYEVHLYPKGYALKHPRDPFAQLEFALKHEGLNLGIIYAFFKQLSLEEVEKYVKKAITGKYARMVWYLYENMMGAEINVPNLKRGGYFDLLDPEEYYTCSKQPSSRHRVNDNLLGNFTFCPFVRKVVDLEEYIRKKLDEVGREIVKRYDPSLISRAMRYFYTKETMSSYAIEREKPGKKRAARFVDLLSRADRLTRLNRETLVELQNIIVEPRFAEKDYRNFQNYVGEQLGWDRQRVHYIAPKPEDVSILMEGLFESLDRMLNSQVDPVIIASVTAFGFVFIHPFGDGNGRLHRFLIHYVLARTNFVSQGGIFPLSALMLRDLQQYDSILESFSDPLLGIVTDWNIDLRGELSVRDNYRFLYQSLDYTRMACYLFQCVEQTIQTDFKGELEFLVRYDEAVERIQEVVDMPNREIDLIIKCIVQNEGTLSSRKKEKLFNLLTEDEVSKIEQVVQETLISD